MFLRFTSYRDFQSSVSNIYENDHSKRSIFEKTFEKQGGNF